MRTAGFLRMHHNEYFHSHPLHGAFSLLTSFLLAGLVVLALVLSAR